MKSFFLTAILAFSALAQAEPSDFNCALLHRTEFIPGEYGLEELKMSARFLAATPHILFRKADDRATGCSSSVISDSGTLLTAGHCIEECMQLASAAQEFPGTSGEPAIRAFKVAPKKGEDTVACSAVIDGQEVKLQVVAARFCHPLSADSNELSDEARKACKGQPDFAILKPVARLPKRPCLKTGSEQDLKNKKMLALGYPGHTNRQEIDPGSMDADGSSEYLSTGKFMSSPTCVVQGSHQTKTVADFDAYSDFLQFDADTVKGSSGGAVILRGSGKIVGLAVGTLSDPNGHCKGSSFATSIGQIRRSLSPSMSANQLDELFSCQKNAIK